jgi:eukaryotic-like serine/threonine-protein kinase
MAAPLKNGERSVRSRVAVLMLTLFPQEPMKSRAEFARILADAKAALPQSRTPVASGVMEVAAKQMSEDPDMLAGTPYRLIRKIGEGASGTVWEAEHVELDRRLAVKVLDQAHSSALGSIDRFRKEAKSIANLRHPNLAYLHDFGKSRDGRVFLAMEFLEGETVARALERRSLALDPLSWQEAVELAIQVTRALEAAHSAGLIHRDLKPENLFLTSGGQLKLLDFGIAVHQSDANEVGAKPHGFSVFGTPEYMAPEQVSGDAVDHRSDIYALGCVLYELTTGRRPFVGNSAVEIMGKQLRDEPQPVEQLARKTPKALSALIETAMKKAPSERFASVLDLRAALEEVLFAPRKAQTRNRVTAALIAGAIIMSAFALGIASRGHSSAAAALADPGARVDAEPAGAAQASGLLVTAPPSGETGSGAPTSTSAQVAVARPQARVAAPPAPASAAEPPRLALHAAASASREQPEPQQALPSPQPLPGDTVAASSERQELTPIAIVPRESPPADLAGTGAIAPIRETPGDSSAASLAQLLQHAQEAAKSHPRDAKSLRAWARAAFRSKSYDEAKRAADAWANIDPSSEPRIVQAQVVYALGKPAEARALLAAYLQRNPSSDDAKHALAKMSGSKDGTQARLPVRLERASAKLR